MRVSDQGWHRKDDTDYCTTVVSGTVGATELARMCSGGVRYMGSTSDVGCACRSGGLPAPDLCPLGFLRRTLPSRNYVSDVPMLGSRDDECRDLTGGAQCTMFGDHSLAHQRPSVPAPYASSVGLSDVENECQAPGFRSALTEGRVGAIVMMGARVPGTELASMFITGRRFQIRDVRGRSLLLALNEWVQSSYISGR